MVNPMSRLLQRRALRADVRRALDAGVGLYRNSWRVEADPATISAELTAWCRQALGEMKRPYGLDHVTLTLSVVDSEGQRIANSDFGVLRPADFYSGPAESYLQSTLRNWASEHLLSADRETHLSITLFSWGDLTRELLLAG